MTTAAPTQSFRAAPTIDWEDLLIAIEDRRVVPVVGRDLLVVPGAGGPSLLYRELATRLAEALGIHPGDLPPEPEIEDVTHRVLVERLADWSTLYARLRALLDKMAPPIPAPLAKLAEIEPLSLVVSTTFDDLLSRALSAAGREALTRHYRPREELVDLQRGGPAEGETFVFQLLGRPSSDPGSYVITDDDMMEFELELSAKLDLADGELKNLGLFLSRRHLLFLGCGFPDWLMRFFVRTLRGERFHNDRPQSRVRVVDRRAPREAPLVMFLERYGTPVYAGDPVAFVDELAERWAARHRGPRSSPSRVAPVGPALAVIASAPEERRAAEAVADKLDQWGIGCAIASFRDGDDAALRGALDGASAFVAVLSERALASGPSRDDPLLAAFRAVDARRTAADSGPLSTLVITLDDIAAKKHRAQRDWGGWLRLARRLHEPTVEDTAWRIAEALLDARKLGVRLPIRMYMAYADADRAWRDQLQGHIDSAVGRSIWLSVWHRGRTAAGESIDAWRGELDRAEVIVLLVSVALLTERRDEVDRAIARYESGGACVVPILVRSCDWLDSLGALSPLPADQSFIASQRDPDAAFRDVVQALLLATFEHVLAPRPVSLRSTP